MLVVRNHEPTPFVGRSNRHWNVLDPEGNFWVLSPVENPWDQRRPFQLKDDADLERVPGHYRRMLGLPFLNHRRVLRPRPPSRWSSRHSAGPGATSPGGGESAAKDGIASAQPFGVSRLYAAEDFKDATIGKW